MVILMWNSFRFPYLIACDKCLFSFMRNCQNMDCFPILPRIQKCPTCSLSLGIGCAFHLSHLIDVMAPCRGISVFFKWLSVLSIFSCVYSPSFVLFGEIYAQVLCLSLWWVSYLSTLMYIWDRVSPHSPGWHSPGWPQTHNTVLASWVLELQVCFTRTHLNCWFLSCWSLRVIYIRMHFDGHSKRSR